jgi:NhaC family Na+:H+ antiporter
MENTYKKRVSFSVALITLLAIVAIMFVGVGFMKIATIALFAIIIVLLSIIALLNGYKMEEVEEAMLTGCKKSSLVVMILIAVGMVVGTWIVSGVVPSIIYYGLKILSPKFFLVLGFIIISLVSFFTGSTYTAVATLGVAFMGIGYGMGINSSLTAGMIVSGSIVGDKMSPFSETSNMAAAIAGTDIFTHLRSCLYTVIPASLISAVLYTVLGLKYGGSSINMENINTITFAIENNFTLSPILILIPILTIALAIKKVPPTLAVLLGALFGLIASFIFQRQFGFATIVNSLSSGFNFDFGMKW